MIQSGATFNGVKVFARGQPSVREGNYAETANCCTDNFDNIVRKAGPTLVDFSGGFQINAVNRFGPCKPYDATDAFSYKYIERNYLYAAGLVARRTQHLRSRNLSERHVRGPLAR
jgi:hypothetical protein